MTVSVLQGAGEEGFRYRSYSALGSLLSPLTAGDEVTAKVARQGAGAVAQSSSKATGGADTVEAQLNTSPCSHCGASDHKWHQQMRVWMD